MRNAQFDLAIKDFNNAIKYSEVTWLSVKERGITYLRAELNDLAISDFETLIGSSNSSTLKSIAKYYKAEATSKKK